MSQVNVSKMMSQIDELQTLYTYKQQEEKREHEQVREVSLVVSPPVAYMYRERARASEGEGGKERERVCARVRERALARARA